MRKTEDYFLRVVPSSENLAPPVAARLEQHPQLRTGKIIFAPAQEYAIIRENRLFSIKFGQRITPERTLIFGDDQLLVIEKQRDSTFNEIVIPFGNLLYVDLAIVLLYGYVTFCWMAGGTLQTLKIEYNGVGDRLMRAEVERLRKTMLCPEVSAPVLSRADWAAIWNSMPLKFANYLYYALFAGEPVLRAVFQPTLNPERRARVSEDRTLALTPEGMIVLEEAREFSKFGMVIRYYPARVIREMRFERAGDRVWLRMSVGASGFCEEAAIPLSESNAACFSEAVQRFMPSIPIRWASEAALSPVGAGR